jgi:hypothetical protein
VTAASGSAAPSTTCSCRSGIITKRERELGMDYGYAKASSATNRHRHSALVRLVRRLAGMAWHGTPCMCTSLPEARRCVDPIMWAAASSGTFGSHDLYRAKTKLLQPRPRPRLRCTTAVHAQSSPTPRPPCSIAISDELIIGAVLSRGPLLSDTLPLFSFRRV